MASKRILKELKDLHRDPRLHAALLQKQSIFSYFSKFNNTNVNTLQVASPASNVATELAYIDWDNLGFGFRPTDYMYMMKCSQGENFMKGELQRFGNIELCLSSGVLNYGQIGVQLSSTFAWILFVDVVYEYNIVIKSQHGTYLGSGHSGLNHVFDYASSAEHAPGSQNHGWAT